MPPKERSPKALRHITVHHLENTLKQLNVLPSDRGRKALNELIQLNEEIFLTYQRTLRSIAAAAKHVSARNRLEILEQVSQRFVNLEVDLYEHLSWHLSSLKSKLASLTGEICGVLEKEERHLRNDRGPKPK